MDEGSNDKRVLDLFTRDSHHQDVTVLYLCQDLFPNGKYAKTISRNAHYITVFKNPRDQLGMRNLLLQSFPDPMARRVWKPIGKCHGSTFRLLAIGSPSSQSGRCTCPESCPKGRRHHAMLSVQTIMLRSEAKWFPRFLLICQSHLRWVMNPEEQDYAWMKRVTECRSRGDTCRGVLRAYNQPHFSGSSSLSNKDQAQKIIAIEDDFQVKRIRTPMT